MIIHDSEFKALVKAEILKDIEAIEGRGEVTSVNDEMELMIQAMAIKQCINLNIRLQLLDICTKEELEKRMYDAISTKLENEHAGLFKGTLGNSNEAAIKTNLSNLSKFDKGTIDQWKQTITATRESFKTTNNQAGTANTIDEKHRE